MKIVSYESAYKNNVIALILHIQNEENHLNLSIDEQPELLHVESTFLESGGGFWVAMENNKIIGTIALLKTVDGAGVLKKFFVDKAYRGEKVGLRLYDTLISFCKENAIHTIILDTPSVATRSHRFYKKAGFTEITKEQLPFAYEYPDRDSLLFLKKL